MCEQPVERLLVRHAGTIHDAVIAIKSRGLTE
jgi:hypothetical protein